MHLTEKEGCNNSGLLRGRVHDIAMHTYFLGLQDRGRKDVWGKEIASRRGFFLSTLEYISRIKYLRFPI